MKEKLTKAGRGNYITATLLIVVLMIFIAICWFLFDMAKPVNKSITDDKTAENEDECKTFKDIEVALSNPESVCILDLSNQGLREVPIEVGSLPNLTTLILSGNNISEDNKLQISEALSKRKPRVGYEVKF